MKNTKIPGKISSWLNSLSEDTFKKYFNEDDSAEETINKYNSLKSDVKIWFDNIPNATKRKYFGADIIFQSSYEMIFIEYETAKSNNGILKRKG